MYRKSVIWPVWVVMLAAISLEVLPLPGFVQPLRPPWAAIAVIYWTMMWPRRFGPRRRLGRRHHPGYFAWDATGRECDRAQYRCVRDDEVPSADPYFSNVATYDDRICVAHD